MSNSPSKHRLPLQALFVIVIALAVPLVKAIREAINFSSKGQRTDRHAHASVPGEIPFSSDGGLLGQIKEETRRIIAGHWFNKRKNLMTTIELFFWGLAVPGAIMSRPGGSVQHLKGTCHGN